MLTIKSANIQTICGTATADLEIISAVFIHKQLIVTARLCSGKIDGDRNALFATVVTTGLYQFGSIYNQLKNNEWFLINTIRTEEDVMKQIKVFHR